MPDQDGTTTNLAERLISEHRPTFDAAWQELLKTLIPRIKRRVARRLRSAPVRIQERADDIESETIFQLVESLRRSSPTISVERFAIGIADNLCRRALDKGRDRDSRSPRSTTDVPGDIPAPNRPPLAEVERESNEPTGSVVFRSRDLRRMFRAGLTAFRDAQEQASLLPRPKSDVQAPILQFLAIDLAMQGRGKAADLISATDLQPHTVSRLRESAINALQDALAPLAMTQTSSVADPNLELTWSHLGPGSPMSDHWAECSVGCIHVDSPFSDAAESHSGDFRKLQMAHEAFCPDCSPISAPSSSEIEEWRNLAEESLARSTFT